MPRDRVLPAIPEAPGDRHDDDTRSRPAARAQPRTRTASNQHAARRPGGSRTQAALHAPRGHPRDHRLRGRRRGHARARRRRPRRRRRGRRPGRRRLRRGRNCQTQAGTAPYPPYPLGFGLAHSRRGRAQHHEARVHDGAAFGRPCRTGTTKVHPRGAHRSFAPPRRTRHPRCAPPRDRRRPERTTTHGAPPPRPFTGARTPPCQPSWYPPRAPARRTINRPRPRASQPQRGTPQHGRNVHGPPHPSRHENRPGAACGAHRDPPHGPRMAQRHRPRKALHAVHRPHAEENHRAQGGDRQEATGENSQSRPRKTS